MPPEGYGPLAAFWIVWGLFRFCFEFFLRLFKFGRYNGER